MTFIRSLTGSREGSDRDKRRLRRRLNDVSHELRRHLDSEQVLVIAARAAQEVVRAERTSVWLSAGEGSPRLACTTDRDRADARSAQPPPAVEDCLRARRPILRSDGGGLAVPIAGPRRGALGAMQLEAGTWTPDTHAFVTGLARETGLALETAALYERAVAEKEKSEAILARIGDAVYLTSASGTITQWNDACERLVGVGAREAVGHACAALWGLRLGDEELDCSAGCPLLALDAGMNGASGQEVWRPRLDGRRQPLLATAKAVRAPDGSVDEVVHSLRDITRLKEADEAKTMFLATASHELKTPLTVIQGFAQTLLADREWTEKDRREALEAMRVRAAQLNKIVDRILLSSRIETGRSDVAPVELEVWPLVLERVEALRAATGREVVADLEADPDGLEGVDALADADALVTVVDHLLDNAVKYSPDGGRVTVSANAGDDAFRLTVADSGIGMDADQAGHCFDRFWQVESSDVRRFGGTGIGLYIVRSLVEAMGGEVSVESRPGAGTVFTVELRRAGAAAGVVAAPVAERPPEPGRGEQSIVREFMRQLGVPERREP